MAVLSKGTTFADGDAVTSTNLNALVDSATFVAGSSGTTDDSTLEVNSNGRLQIKALGVGTAQLSASSVTTAKIADDSVTPAKLSSGGISWDTSGNVTIVGNLSATVADSSARATITNESSTAARIPGFAAVNYTGGYASSYTVFSGSIARGSSGTPAAVQTNDIFVRFAGIAHDGSSFSSSGFIDIAAAENWTASAHGSSMSFYLTENGSTSPSFVMSLSNAGDLNVTGSYKVDSAQVLGNRITGWAAATGTATRTTFATSTVTTAQLAERVKALIDDLRTHGLIGN